MSFLCKNVPFGFQVNEIYHEESLGVHINVVLVRMIMLGYAKVSSQYQFLCITPVFLESVWKCFCSQWEREKQEIRFNSMWCIVSSVIWGPIENVFGTPGWAGIRQKALRPNDDWELSGSGSLSTWQLCAEQFVVFAQGNDLTQGRHLSGGGGEQISVASASVWLQQPWKDESHKAFVLGTQSACFESAPTSS